MNVRLLAGVVLGGLLGAGSSLAGADEKDVVETAVTSKDHTILVAAVKEAGLVEVLKGKGPFTVFAPTDAAFKKLGDDKIKAVLKDKELLTKILKSHVVSGKVMAADVVKLDGQDVETLSGAKFKVSKDGPKIGPAKVTAADLKCSNGVIHVIDEVLIPTP